MKFIKIFQKRFCFGFLIVWIFLFFNQIVLAQSDPFKLLTNAGFLKGVKKISVSVGGLETNLKAEGITEEKLEMDVE